jgi:hypothetical protein
MSTKLRLISQFFISCNSFITFFVVFELVQLIVVVISFLCFNLMYYRHKFFSKMEKVY